jgi:hypothetical protein
VGIEPAITPEAPAIGWVVESGCAASSVAFASTAVSAELPDWREPEQAACTWISVAPSARAAKRNLRCAFIVSSRFVAQL